MRVQQIHPLKRTPKSADAAAHESIAAQAYKHGLPRVPDDIAAPPLCTHCSASPTLALSVISSLFFGLLCSYCGLSAALFPLYSCCCCWLLHEPTSAAVQQSCREKNTIQNKLERRRTF